MIQLNHKIVRKNIRPTNYNILSWYLWKERIHLQILSLNTFLPRLKTSSTKQNATSIHPGVNITTTMTNGNTTRNKMKKITIFFLIQADL